MNLATLTILEGGKQLKKVRERTGQYEVSVRAKNNNKYYEARISFKLGGVGNNPRLQKGGKSIELAVLSLLTALSEYIDICFKSGIIITKLDDMITAKLVKSINDLGILTPKVTEKTLEITKKINDINSTILNTFTVPNNVIPFYNQNLNTNTSNLVPFPTPANIIPTTTPAIHNATNNVGSEPIQPIIIEDLALEWLKYRQSLCQKTEDNPKPLSRKTLDNNRNRLKNDILPYLKRNKILYLSQITEDCIKSLLKSIKSQNSKHKSHETLNLLFKYAIDEKNFKDNPVLRVDKPPEQIKTGQEEDDNYIESDRQDLWLDLFEKEHKANNNNPNHLHRDIALLFEIMLLTGIRPEEACRFEMEFISSR